MAEITENPFQNNFGIENTMEMGLGSAELLGDLLESDSATGNPDDLEEIEKATEKEKAPEKKQRSVIPTPGKEKEENEEEKLPSGEDLVSSLLNSKDDDDEEESDDSTPGTKTPEETKEESEQAPSQFTALARDLKQLGVFTSEEGEDDPEITTPEEFLDRFNAEKQKGAISMVNNFIGQFGEDYQNAFEAIFVKGVDPKAYFGTYNKIVKFAELDLSIEANQVEVMNQALTDQGFEPEDITTEIERLKSYGDLEQLAMKHHKVLVKKEALKLQDLEKQAEQELQQKAAVRAQYVQNVQTILQDKIKTKEFDGIPINPKLANELHDFLLIEKYKTSNGELLTDFDKAVLELKRPENHAMKVKVALLLKLLEKDPTLSTIQQSGVTKKSDKLFGELARQTEKSKPPVNRERPNSWFKQ